MSAITPSRPNRNRSSLRISFLTSGVHFGPTAGIKKREVELMDEPLYDTGFRDGALARRVGNERVLRVLREVLVDFDVTLNAMDVDERRDFRQMWPSIQRVRDLRRDLQH